MTRLTIKPGISITKQKQDKPKKDSEVNKYTTKT